MPKQASLQLNSGAYGMHLNPLALLYLLAIYNSEFEDRVRNGWYRSHPNYQTRLDELIKYELVEFNGLYRCTVKGAQHIRKLLRIEV